MDGNRDDAERCLQLAAVAMRANDVAKATRLLAKSRRMYPLPEQQARFEAALKLHIASTSSSNASSSTSRAQPDRDSNPDPPEETRQATPEMISAVRRVQKLSNKSHYEVIGVPRDADEAAIKRAYRKLALRLHPDRNQAPGADDAFKRVGQAFVVLSDTERRAHYDQFGTDGPEHQPVRSARRRKRRARGDAQFEDFDHARHEMSHEELFEFLFQAAAGRPAFAAQGFGPDAFFTARRNVGGRVYRERGGFEGGEEESMCERMRPMLLMMFIVTLAMVFAQDAGQPAYSLMRSGYYSVEGVTRNHVRYYMARGVDLSRSSVRKRVERMVDEAAWEEYAGRCQQEKGRKEFLRQQSRKWLIGKERREQYRRQYEAFEKPWCRKAEALGSLLREQNVR